MTGALTSSEDVGPHWPDADILLFSLSPSTARLVLGLAAAGLDSTISMFVSTLARTRSSLAAAIFALKIKDLRSDELSFRFLASGSSACSTAFRLGEEIPGAFVPALGGALASAVSTFASFVAALFAAGSSTGSSAFLLGDELAKDSVPPTDGAFGEALEGAVESVFEGAVEGAIEGAIEGAVDGPVEGAANPVFDEAFLASVGRADDGVVGEAAKGAADGTAV